MKPEVSSCKGFVLMTQDELAEFLTTSLNGNLNKQKQKWF